jgi:hypothetical protein
MRSLETSAYWCGVFCLALDVALAPHLLLPFPDKEKSWDVESKKTMGFLPGFSTFLFHQSARPLSRSLDRVHFPTCPFIAKELV